MNEIRKALSSLEWFLSFHESELTDPERANENLLNARSELAKLTAENGKNSATIEFLDSKVQFLKAENAHLTAYANELAAGWPPDLLPADIRNIRDVNLKFAQQVHDLAEAIESLRFYVNNPSAWDDFAQNVSDAIARAIAVKDGINEKDN